jgi:hypothetical protein
MASRDPVHDNCHRIPQHRALGHLPEEPVPFHYPRARANRHDRCARQRNPPHPTPHHHFAAADALLLTVETSCMFRNGSLDSAPCESGFFEATHFPRLIGLLQRIDVERWM